MLQRVLHQLLGGHIDHIVLAADDIIQLCIDTIYYQLGRLVAIQVMGLAPHQSLQLSV